MRDHIVPLDDVALIASEAEQTIINDIRAMRAGGKTLKQIAPVLSERGILTKTGRSTHWTHQAVVRILGSTKLTNGSRPGTYPARLFASAVAA